MGHRFIAVHVMWQVLALVETDKATMDMESTKDGFFAKVLVKEGTTEIALGQVSNRFYLPYTNLMLTIGSVYFSGEQRGCCSF